LDQFLKVREFLGISDQQLGISDRETAISDRINESDEQGIQSITDYSWKKEPSRQVCITGFLVGWETSFMKMTT